jgi:hypothetical protein
MAIEELDHLIALDPATEVKKYLNEDVLADRIAEWLETPQGTLADLPAWGHNLRAFKFEPPGINLDVMIEMSLVVKMPKDIENLVIVGVDVEFKEIDLLKLTIRHMLGVYEDTVTL